MRISNLQLAIYDVLASCNLRFRTAPSLIANRQCIANHSSLIANSGGSI